MRAAAEELAVTPAAVSQQLRVLEAHLGIALTQRHGRGLALTDSGRTWHGEIARHLRAIALAAERVRPGRRVVQVTVVQSFGSRWLMPRLSCSPRASPRSRCASTRARCSPTSRATRSTSRSAKDAASIPTPNRCGCSRSSSCRSRLPPSRGSMQRRNGTIDWSRARLLHEVSYDYWPDWIAAAGVTDVDVARGLFFSHTMLALDAAFEGQGVALAPLCLADRELARGALSIVDPRPFTPGTGIYLAWPRRGLRTLSPAAIAFRDWLIEEAQAAAGVPQCRRPNLARRPRR